MRLKGSLNVSNNLELKDLIMDGQISSEVLSEFYLTLSRLAETQEEQDLNFRKSLSARNCHRIMYFDYYQKQGLKDFTWTMRALSRPLLPSVCQRLSKQ